MKEQEEQRINEILKDIDKEYFKLKLYQACKFAGLEIEMNIINQEWSSEEVSFFINKIYTPNFWKDLVYERLDEEWK